MLVPLVTRLAYGCVPLFGCKDCKVKSKITAEYKRVVVKRNCPYHVVTWYDPTLSDTNRDQSTLVFKGMLEGSRIRESVGSHTEKYNKDCKSLVMYWFLLVIGSWHLVPDTTYLSLTESVVIWCLTTHKRAIRRLTSGCLGPESRHCFAHIGNKSVR